MASLDLPNHRAQLRRRATSLSVRVVLTLRRLGLLLLAARCDPPLWRSSPRPERCCATPGPRHARSGNRPRGRQPRPPPRSARPLALPPSHSCAPSRLPHAAAMRCPKSFASSSRGRSCQAFPVRRSGTSTLRCGRTFDKPTEDVGTRGAIRQQKALGKTYGVSSLASLSDLCSHSKTPFERASSGQRHETLRLPNCSIRSMENCHAGRPPGSLVPFRPGGAGCRAPALNHAQHCRQMRHAAA